MRRPPVAGQLARFIVVGAANTALTLAVIWSLQRFTETPLWAASALGYVAGMVQGFLLSRYWTFGGTRQAASVPAQVAGFVAVNLVCGAVFTQANVWLSAWLPVLLSSLAATALVLPLSFALNRWGVFRPTRDLPR